jgi:hypothetical protein
MFDFKLLIQTPKEESFHLFVSSKGGGLSYGADELSQYKM